MSVKENTALVCFVTERALNPGGGPNYVAQGRGLELHRGTRSGQRGDIPPTGKSFTVSGVDMRHVANGKVAEPRISNGMSRVLTETGILPPADGRL
jgi:hypothetical protein